MNPPFPPLAAENPSPDRTTPTGQLINSYLTAADSDLPAETIHLLFSANRWEALPTLLSSLNAGETLIVDRYVYSGIAFSVAKGLGYDWCKAPDIGLPRPDAVVFLDVKENVQEGRGGFGGERYETSEMQRKVRGVFEQLRMEQAGEEDWVVVDAGGGVEEVAIKVWGVVERAVEWARGNGLRRFE